MLALVAATAVQLVPLPGRIVDVLSPHARAVWSRLSLALPRALPLTIDMSAGAWALTRCSVNPAAMSMMPQTIA